MNKVQKIRAEIERLYNQSLADENRQAELGLKSAACTSYGKSKVCKELLSFIDSLQEESQVKESAETQHDNETCKENGNLLTQEPVSEDLEEAAENYASTDEVLPNGKVMIDFQAEKAFKAGAKWKKERMSKQVLDATIHPSDGEIWVDCIFDLAPFKEDEKVKLIIIKEN